MRGNPLENRLDDPVVSAFGQPTAALVATSKVEGEHRFREALHHRVVQLDSLRDPILSG